MRANAEAVIRAWYVGKPARSATSKQTGDAVISTDGFTLYSYRMPIAKWRILPQGPDAKRKARAHVIIRDRAPSATTRSHIDAVMRADLMGLAFDRVLVGSEEEL